MSAGKGDTPRPVNGDKFRSNYDRIFKPSNPMSEEIAWAYHNDPRWYPGVDYAEVARITGQPNRMEPR